MSDKSVGVLIRQLRAELGRMPRKQKALTVEAVLALEQLAMRVWQLQRDNKHEPDATITVTPEESTVAV